MHTGTDISVDHEVRPAATRERGVHFKNAALLGYYGMGNLGDELMLICLTAWLAQQGIEAVPIASNAEKVRQLHGTAAVQNYPMLGQFSWVEALVRGKVFQTLKAILRADMVIAGGGDVFRDALGWRGFSYQVEKFVFAVLFGKPVFLLNVGISRPVTFYARKLLSWLLRRCRYIVVREQRSLELCRELGAADRVALLPDIVLSFPDFFPSAKASTHAENTILVALHGNPNVYGQYLLTDARLGALAGVLDSMVDEHDLSIHFFPFQPFDAGGDLQIHREVQSRMRQHERTKLLDWTIDPAEIARRFSSCRLVLAMRLHAAVLSVAFQRPCVVLPYDEKVSAFAREMNICSSVTAGMLDVPAQAKAVLDEALAAPSVTQKPEMRRIWLSFQLPEEPFTGRCHAMGGR